MSTLAHLLAFLAANLLAARACRGLASGDKDSAVSAHLLLLGVALCGIVLALDLGSLFQPLPMLALAGAILLLLRRQWRWAVGPWVVIARELRDAARAFPPAVLLVLLPFVVQLATPVPNGDSLVYHLPNVRQFIVPDTIFAPGDPTAYYPRGMEAIYAFFHTAPLSRAMVVLFKWLLFFSFYFLLKSRCGSRAVAAALCTFLISTEVIRGDLGNLKNDLPLALLVTYAAVALTRRDAPNRPPGAAPALALALACAIKPNAALYAAWLLPLWLWRERTQFWRAVWLGIGVLAPLALCFYLENWLRHGSPIHFPGNVTMSGTSILANLDWQLPLQLLRGLLRQLGPAGLLALAAALGALAWRAVTRRGPTALESLALGACLLAFTATPLSDHNTPTVHGQLYSGHTVRLALPFILFTITLVAPLLAAWLETHPRRARLCAAVITTGALVNLFWYDLVALATKPGNAFMDLAPALGTFDNTALALAMAALAGILAVLAFASARSRPAARPPAACGMAVVVLLAGAVVVQERRWPASQASLARFKQMGETSGAFAHLDQHPPRPGLRVVCATAPEGAFVGAMNGVLMQERSPVRFTADLRDATNAALIAVCATDVETGGGLVAGRTFDAVLPPIDAADFPAGYRCTYRDRFYVLLEPAP